MNGVQVCAKVLVVVVIFITLILPVVQIDLLHEMLAQQNAQ